MTLARSLFERSVALHGEALEIGEPCTIRIVQKEEIKSCYHANLVVEFFSEKLLSYGLVLVSAGIYI